jgi:hypothetical protein
LKDVYHIVGKYAVKIKNDEADFMNILCNC